MDDTETTLSCNAFQILAATTRKAGLPIVDSLKEGAAGIMILMPLVSTTWFLSCSI